MFLVTSTLERVSTLFSEAMKEETTSAVDKVAGSLFNFTKADLEKIHKASTLLNDRVQTLEIFERNLPNCDVIKEFTTDPKLYTDPKERLLWKLCWLSKTQGIFSNVRLLGYLDGHVCLTVQWGAPHDPLVQEVVIRPLGLTSLKVESLRYRSTELWQTRVLFVLLKERCMLPEKDLILMKKILQKGNWKDPEFIKEIELEELTLNGSHLTTCSMPYEEVRKIQASVLKTPLGPFKEKERPLSFSFPVPGKMLKAVQDPLASSTGEWDLCDELEDGDWQVVDKT